MSSILNIRNTYTETIEADGSTDSFTLQYTPASIRSVKVNGIIDASFAVEGKVITLSSIPEAEASITIDYTYFSSIPVINGKNGKSAYEIAKEGGYTGSQDDFNTALGNLAHTVILKRFTLTIPADGWEGDEAPYTQTISVDSEGGSLAGDVLADDEPELFLVTNSDTSVAALEREAYALFTDVETNDGALTFTCDVEKPTQDVNLRVRILRENAAGSIDDVIAQNIYTTLNTEV